MSASVILSEGAGREASGHAVEESLQSQVRFAAQEVVPGQLSVITGYSLSEQLQSAGTTWANRKSATRL